MRKERIDVRIEPELLEELDIIAQRSNQSRSSAIRDAVAEHVMEQKDNWNSRKLSVNIPNRLADKVERALLNGDATDLDDLIKQALVLWTRDLDDYYLNKKDKLDQMAAENARNDSAKVQLEVNAKQLARK